MKDLKGEFKLGVQERGWDRAFETEAATGAETPMWELAPHVALVRQAETGVGWGGTGQRAREQILEALWAAWSLL